MHKNVRIRIALVLCYQKIFTPALKVVCPLRKSKDGIFGDVLAAGGATLLTVIRRRSIIGVDIFWWIFAGEVVFEQIRRRSLGGRQ